MYLATKTLLISKLSLETEDVGAQRVESLNTLALRLILLGKLLRLLNHTFNLLLR